MKFARSAALFVLLGALTNAPAQDDSKPVLMSTTKANTWSDLNELQQDAAAGKTEAMAALGEMLLTGDQVTKDVNKGLELLAKASAAGHANASFRLGKVYEDGELVERDPAKALEYYRKAALAGVAEAQYNLGAMYVSARGVKRDYKQGLAWLIVATKSGAEAEGEKQVRERLVSTNRAQLIAEAETLAVELQKEIDQARTAAEAKAAASAPAGK
jgi:uncharacterized protein